MRDGWWYSTIAVALVVAVAAACSHSAVTGETYLERVSSEHHGDAPVRAMSPAAEGALPQGVTVIYGRAGGRPLAGFLARPAGSVESPPAVMLIHEWWGLNDNIRDMVRRFAAAGYAALALDLFDGAVAEDSEGARALVVRATSEPEHLDENLRQAYRFLRDELRAPRVASLGWCFGGGMSLRAALLMPEELDAAIIYYGRLVHDPAALQRLQMPILGIFGERDRSITVEEVERFEDTLLALGKQAHIYLYQGADHAFANPSGRHYDAHAAADAWQRTLAFLHQHLE